MFVSVNAIDKYRIVEKIIETSDENVLEEVKSGKFIAYIAEIISKYMKTDKKRIYQR